MVRASRIALWLQVVGAGTVTLSSGGSLYATVYARQSAVTVSGSSAIYRSVVGGSVTESGSAAIHHNLSPIRHVDHLACPMT
jgi:hypothetical protein